MTGATGLDELKRLAHTSDEKARMGALRREKGKGEGGAGVAEEAKEVSESSEESKKEKKKKRKKRPFKMTARKVTVLSSKGVGWTRTQR